MENEVGPHGVLVKGSDWDAGGWGVKPHPDLPDGVPSVYAYPHNPVGPADLNEEGEGPQEHVEVKDGLSRPRHPVTVVPDVLGPLRCVRKRQPVTAGPPVGGEWSMSRPNKGPRRSLPSLDRPTGVSLGFPSEVRVRGKVKEGLRRVRPRVSRVSLDLVSPRLEWG